MCVSLCLSLFACLCVCPFFSSPVHLYFTNTHTHTSTHTSTHTHTHNVHIYRLSGVGGGGLWNVPNILSVLRYLLHR